MKRSFLQVIMVALILAGCHSPRTRKPRVRKKAAPAAPAKVTEKAEPVAEVAVEEEPKEEVKEETPAEVEVPVKEEPVVRKEPVVEKEEEEPLPRCPRVHSVTDLSHQFSFYADGRFYKQYLKDPKNGDNRNWGTLHKYDFSDTNLLVLLGGNTPCRYFPEDIAAVKALLEEGGGVAMMGNYGTFREEKVYHINELAGAFGAKFLDERATKPFTPAESLKAEGIVTSSHPKIISLTEPKEWRILLRDGRGRTLMARRRAGKGSLLIATRSLFGHRPNASDPINAQWVRPLLHDVASHKMVSEKFKRGEWAKFDNVVKHGTMTLQYSDYLQSEADAVIEIYDRCMPVLEEITGVPPSKGMMGALLLLPTGGGGFSSGHKIGLGIWWGGFPNKEYGMIELIGHESTHSWVLPFSEPMWNEPIATYLGALLGEKLGYPEEGRRAIQNRINGGLKHDPDMTKCDIAFGKGVPNSVMWGKSMWLWEQMRKEKPDIVARYFRAKRRLADPKKIRKYTPHECVAVLSHAMGRDMFKWFRKHGVTVSAEKSAIPYGR